MLTSFFMNKRLLNNAIKAIPGAIKESLVGIRCHSYFKSAFDIKKLKNSIEFLQNEIDQTKNIDSNKYGSDIKALKTGHNDVLHKIEMVKNHSFDDIERVEKTIAHQQVQNIIKHGQINNLFLSYNRKIAEQNKEVEKLKSLHMVDRYKQQLENKMLKKDFKEIQESIYEMKKEEINSQMVQELINPEWLHIRELLEGPLDAHGEKKLSERISFVSSQL
ncbi:unnamed protein product [Oikopleura dioica]|uniref:Uncharacterized protein n=2 Tax=Oikopleura dioica TaxID=34765 RepID=E4XXD3_OIKDI|nr:unnamed protein product [Oikopleura dioica]